MSILLTFAAQLSPAQVLSPAEESLWRLGEPFELWYVEGRHIHDWSKDVLCSFHLIRGGRHVRDVGQASSVLIPRIGEFWDGRLVPGKLSPNLYHPGGVNAVPPGYEGGCLRRVDLRVLEQAVVAAGKDASEVYVAD